MFQDEHVENGFGNARGGKMGGLTHVLGPELAIESR